MSAPTRRSLLGGAAVLAAAPAALAAASPHPDAELLRLDTEMAEAITREDAAWETVDAIASDEDDDPLRVRASELTEEVGEIVERVGKVSATTLDGLLVKLRGILWCQSGGEFEAGNLEPGLWNAPPSTHAVVLATLLNDLVRIGAKA